MIVKQFHFQKILDLDFWKNYIKPDGWNLKKGIIEIKNGDSSEIIESKRKWFENLMNLTKSNDNCVNKTEVYMYLGIMFWDDGFVKESFECFNSALKKMVIEPAVRIL